MSGPVLAALLWALAANVLGMLPSKDHYWSRAYVLMAIAAPIFVWLWWEQGPLLALVFAAMAASIFRWPLVYLWRWIKRMSGRS